MNRRILTGEEAEEFKRLYDEYPRVSQHAAELLGRHGMESKEFREADAAVGDLWRRLRELQGMAGKHWMA